MVMLINRRIGTMRLDAVINETHTAELKITENPVESGANIADHAYAQPRTLKIKGIVVEHYDPLAALAAEVTPGLRSSVDFVDEVKPGILANLTRQARNRAQRELKSWLKPQVDTPKARPLAPWMLEYQPLSRFDSSPSILPTTRLLRASSVAMRLRITIQSMGFSPACARSCRPRQTISA